MDTFGAGRNKPAGDGSDGTINKNSNELARIEADDAGEGSSSGVNGHNHNNSSNNLKSSVAPSLPIQLTHSLEQLLSKGNYVHCPNPDCKVFYFNLNYY